LPRHEHRVPPLHSVVVRIVRSVDVPARRVVFRPRLLDVEAPANGSVPARFDRLFKILRVIGVQAPPPVVLDGAPRLGFSTTSDQRYSPVGKNDSFFVRHLTYSSYSDRSEQTARYPDGR